MTIFRTNLAAVGVQMICKCTKLSIEKIEALAQTNTSWIDASAESGAGRYCGGCIRKIRERFNQARLERHRKVAAAA